MKWKIDRLTNKGTVCNGKVRFAITCNDDGFKRDVIATTPYADKFPEEYHETNAKLISAAPELLAFAQKWVEFRNGEDTDPKELWYMATQAIAKAEVIK